MIDEVQRAVRHGNWPSARRMLEECLRQDPGRIELYRHLAQVCETLGDWPATERALHRYLLGRPDHVEGHYRLGRVLEKQGKVARAEAGYRRVLELEPGHQAARGALDDIRTRRPIDIVQHRMKKVVGQALPDLPDFVDPEEIRSDPRVAALPPRRAHRSQSNSWWWPVLVMIGVAGILGTVYLPQLPRRDRSLHSEWQRTQQPRDASLPLRSGAMAASPAERPFTVGSPAMASDGGGGRASRSYRGGAGSNAVPPAPQSAPLRDSPSDRSTPEADPDEEASLRQWLAQAFREADASGAAINPAAALGAGGTSRPGGWSASSDSQDPSAGFGLTGLFPAGSPRQAGGGHPAPTAPRLGPCPTCTGQGAVPDPACGGTGMLPCGGPAGGTSVASVVQCQGGTVSCSLHFGENCTICDDQQGAPCPACQGSGEVSCFVCNGAGMSYCAHCGGQGQVAVW